MREIHKQFLHNIIKKTPDVDQKEIADRLGFSLAYVVELIEELVKEGKVEYGLNGE
jgi:predicted transcriptional regulator